MKYEIKKSSGNYSVGRNSHSGIFKNIVSGITGLALLISNIGCIDTINGIRVRADEKPIYVKYDGEVPKPKEENKEDKKDEDKFYTSPWFWVGVGVTGATIGAGIAYGEKENWGKSDRHRRSPGGSDSGGGENGGGPGGQ